MYDVCNFYGCLSVKFIQAINRKVKLLNSYWSTKKEIDVSKYFSKPGNQLIYYYFPNGRLMDIRYDTSYN